MKVFTLLLLLAVLLILVPHYSGRPALPEAGFQDFTLLLATPKTKYLELETLPIVITLKNETQSSLMGHTVLGFDSGYLRLYVDRGNGPQEIRQLSVLRSSVYAKPREFKPGDEVKIIQPLNLKLDEVFPTPGIYKLHAQLVAIGGKETVSSKPIEVEITQPVGLDAQALDFIRTFDEPAFFFTGARLIRKPERLQQLENFVAVFGESTYGDDASFLLGEVLVTKRDYQRARKVFDKLSKKSDFAFAGKASDYLKHIDREEKEKRR